MARDHQETERLPPCDTVDDLFAPDGKRLIARLTRGFLADNGITVTEFLHRAELLIKFENTGKLLQFLVQQIAVARAAEANQPVHELIKSLHKLFDQLVHRVHNDKRENRYPAIKPDNAAAVAATLAAAPNGTYLFDGALSQYLRDARSWNEKVVRLVDVLAAAGSASGGNPFLTDRIDAMLAEMFANSAAIDDLIGAMEFFGDTIFALLTLYQGVPQNGQYGDGQALARLAEHFAKQSLPNARAALAAHIVMQIRSEEPLRGDSIEGELKMLRRIVDHAAASADYLLYRLDLVPALERRCAAVIADDDLSRTIARKDWPEDKLEWLFFANQCVLGAENKRQLAETAIRICNTGAFKNHFLLPNVPLSQRLQKLAYLNARVLESDFAESHRLQLTEALNSMALEVASRGKMFEAIEAKCTDPAEKAAALLTLFAAGAFAEGSFSRKARQTILRYVSQPGFLECGADDTETTKADWLKRLQRAGIPAEASLKAFAASEQHPSSAPLAPQRSASR